MRRGHASDMQALLTPNRQEAYFLRLNGYSSAAENQLIRLYEAARQSGVIMEGKIPNPTDANLAYYNEMLGMDFRLEIPFIAGNMGKWLPRMNHTQQQGMAQALFDTLKKMELAGKTLGMLKNAYTRFMCWLYFKFERVAVKLGSGNIPLVLYQGEMTAFELNFFTILCNAGCDILFIQCGGDDAYLKLDPRGEYSDLVQLPGARPFPAGFSVNALYKEHVNRQMAMQRPVSSNPSGGVNLQRPGTAPASGGVNLQRPGAAPASGGVNLQRPGAAPASGGVNLQRPGTAAPVPAPPPQPRVNIQRTAPQPMNRPPVAPPQRPVAAPTSAIPPRPAQPIREQPLQIPRTEYVICPNAWMDGGNTFENIVTPCGGRGTDEKLIYTCFLRMEGVEDKLTYPNELLQMHLRLKEGGRKTLILEEGIAPPTSDEIAQIRRQNYPTINTAINHLADNFRGGVALGLQNLAVKAFMEVLEEESKKPGVNVNKIVNTAVYLLCWFKRYYPALLEGWQPKKLGCLIHLGPCKGEREALFLRMMAKLPVDVIILCPNLEEACILQDPMLFVQKFAESLVIRHLPRENGQVRINTAASNAEHDLDSTLYHNTGLYRDRQFDVAQALLLDSTYEEISLYWDQELKYRPGFNTVNETVMLPVLFAQVSGIKNGDQRTYWQSVKKLMTPNAHVIKGFPFYHPVGTDFTASSVVEFFRNGKIQREKIKNHRNYPFALFRAEVQEHIFNKLQTLIDQRMIRGTFENGTEYQIVATILNLKKELIRMIQQFDFTKKNPKVLCINTGETAASKEDAIILAFLHLVGFDVVCFVPTGYQCLGQWYNTSPLVEHQIGDYVYDLTIPDLNNIVIQNPNGWNIFRRGR
ncbi:MAG: hypothetical protein E7324_00510 [Clostridiales bacterium]|nr:hypothetical protein [Clostridiales bacterium]